VIVVFVRGQPLLRLLPATLPPSGGLCLAPTHPAPTALLRAVLTVVAVLAGAARGGAGAGGGYATGSGSSECRSRAEED
jgi:hypothetical protein